MPLVLPLPRFQAAIFGKSPYHLAGGPFYRASVRSLLPIGGAHFASSGLSAGAPRLGAASQPQICRPLRALFGLAAQADCSVRFRIRTKLKASAENWKMLSTNARPFSRARRTGPTVFIQPNTRSIHLRRP